MSRQKTIHDSAYRYFISVLRAERTRLGLSQAEVATQLTMRQSDLSKVETLDRKLDVRELRDILKVYRIDTNVTLQNALTSYFQSEPAN